MFSIINEKDLPQLIVGLDSLDESANYIHIADVKENINYYCPCCKGLIKPRAYKKNEKYHVQPHFYHVGDGCGEETYIHYICKTWLFEKGCRFIIDNIEHEVESVDIEKTLHTSFGDYRPDIIVTTTLGKIFYFEIKATNKKSELYAPKWDELKNDVVEVDTRYFINQKCKNNIPVFRLIYSNGECFIKSYSKNDYENTIAKRKLEWKRQDKINYKIQWERLDWFWSVLTDYKQGICDDSLVIEYFSQLDYQDKLWCYQTIVNKSCIKLKEKFKDNINQHFYQMLESYNRDEISISSKQISPRIYEIKLKVTFTYLDYDLFEEEIIKIKLQKGNILSLDYENDIVNGINCLQQKNFNGEQILKKIYDVTALPYVKSIIPHSHWATQNYPLHNLCFNVEFEDNIHNRYIKEFVGEEEVLSTSITKRHIQKIYNERKMKVLSNLDDELIQHALKNDSLYQKTIYDLKDIYRTTTFLKIEVSKDNKTISLLNGLTCVYEYKYSEQDVFGKFENRVKENFIAVINKQIKQYEVISKYIKKINLCANKMWKAQFNDNNSYYVDLSLQDVTLKEHIKTVNISLFDSEDIENNILNEMKGLLKWFEDYYEIRFMEVV